MTQQNHFDKRFNKCSYNNNKKKCPFRWVSACSSPAFVFFFYYFLTSVSGYIITLCCHFSFFFLTILCQLISFLSLRLYQMFLWHLFLKQYISLFFFLPGFCSLQFIFAASFFSGLSTINVLFLTCVCVCVRARARAFSCLFLLYIHFSLWFSIFLFSFSRSFILSFFLLMFSFFSCRLT